MEHTHEVYDTEIHFEINGSNKFIKELSSTKLVLAKGDHNSKVVKFKMPRYICGHDMLLCNRVRVHYINVEKDTNEKSKDIYKVTDLSLCEDTEDTLAFTWTIEAPATKYNGTLAFAIKFECVEDGNILYQWNTAMYSGVSVLEGIDNSEEFIGKYSNVLEEWYNEFEQQTTDLTNRVEALENKGTGSGATKEQLAQIEKNKQDIGKLSEQIANIGVGGLCEPMEDDLPKVFFTGTAPTTKAEDELPLTMEYHSKTLTFKNYVTLKVQGDSSATFPKKNFNLKMFKDSERTEKDKRVFRNWAKTHKFCLKANWIDVTQARNVVNGRLWGQVVRTRADYQDYPQEYIESTNCGAVDGFPIKVYLNGVYQGRYTWNIRKDESMWNMDDKLGTHAALIADNGNDITLWKSMPMIDGSDWTDELNDTVPNEVRTSFENLYSFVINSTDEEFVANIDDYFYSSSLIDYFVFIYTILMAGGLFKSQTMLTYDCKKWLANIYDMDTTWALRHHGQSFYPYTTACPSGYEGYNSGYTNLLYERLMALYAERIKERYFELRQSVLSEANIINEFERFMDSMPPHLVEEDFAETTANGAFTNIPSATTNNIQTLRDIIVTRLAYCDIAIATLGEENNIEWQNIMLVNDGSMRDSNIRISTVDYLPDNISSVQIGETYSMLVNCYDFTGQLVGYAGYDDEGNFIGAPAPFGSNGNYYQQTHDINKIKERCSFVKLMIKKQDESEILPTDGNNVIYERNENPLIIFGRIQMTDGNESPTKHRLLTTTLIPDSVTHFTCKDGYEAGVVCYNENREYGGFWNCNTNTIGVITWKQSADLTLPRNSEYGVIRILMRRTDNAEITIEESSNIIFS